MSSLLPLVVLLAGVAWALERNHRSQPSPRPSRQSSSDVLDRDAERVRAELRAAAARTPADRGVDHVSHSADPAERATASCPEAKAAGTLEMG